MVKEFTMWIKAQDGTLHNASTFSRIWIRKNERNTRNNQFDDSPLRPEEILPTQWLIEGDNKTLAKYESEKEADQALSRLADGLGAVGFEIDLTPKTGATVPFKR